MKRLLLLLVFMAKVALCLAQYKGVADGEPRDSTIFTFEPTDSLNHSLKEERIDTTGTRLWMVASIGKPFLTFGAIMTDTSQPYPVNADDHFTLRLCKKYDPGNINVIVSFWHKYQTTIGHDGGVVEFSIDNGANWQNVMDSCNTDPTGWGEPGVKTTNFYTKADTLLNGRWAFSGTSNGWMYSRLQFFWGPPEKGTAQYCLPNDSVFIRFRFISDDTAETLAGWIIDDIKVEHDHYGTLVHSMSNADNYRPYPNPSHDGIFYLPELKNEKQYRVEVYNTMGAKVFNSPYQHQLDLHALPEGVYFYKVTNGETGYSGKLLLSPSKSSPKGETL